MAKLKNFGVKGTWKAKNGFDSPGRSVRPINQSVLGRLLGKLLADPVLPLLGHLKTGKLPLAKSRVSLAPDGVHISCLGLSGFCFCKTTQP